MSDGRIVGGVLAAIFGGILAIFLIGLGIALLAFGHLCTTHEPSMGVGIGMMVVGGILIAGGVFILWQIFKPRPG